MAAGESGERICSNRLSVRGAVDGREHHHLTEQSDLNGLQHLCQSLQDHLKYCGLPLGGRDKRVGLERCAIIQMRVCDTYV